MSCSYQRAGRLAWAERPDPELVDRTDALVRPFIAARCDGDTVPLHRPVSRAMQLGIALHAIDPVVACICGRVPFRGPFAIGTNPSRRSSRSARTSAASPSGRRWSCPGPCRAATTTAAAPA